MSKIRKALVAFLGGAAGTIVGAIVQGQAPTDGAGWATLIGAAIGVGLAAAYAVWRVPNAPAVTPAADASIKRPWTA